MFNFLSLWRSRLVAAWIVCPLFTPCDRNEVLCRCSVLVQYFEDVSLIYTPPPRSVSVCCYSSSVAPNLVFQRTDVDRRGWAVGRCTSSRPWFCCHLFLLLMSMACSPCPQPKCPALCSAAPQHCSPWWWSGAMGMWH